MAPIILSFLVSRLGAQTVPPQVEQQAAVLAAKNAPKIARHLKPKHNPLKRAERESHLIGTKGFLALHQMNAQVLDLQKYRLVDATRYFSPAGLQQYEKKIAGDPVAAQRANTLAQALQKSGRLTTTQSVIGLLPEVHEIFFVAKPGH